MPASARRLVKMGVGLFRPGRYAISQMAEAALPRQVCAGIRDLINGLRGQCHVLRLGSGLAERRWWR